MTKSLNSLKARFALVGACALSLGTAHAGGPTTHDVLVGSMTFNPSALTIDVGDTVRFTWGNFGFHDVVQTVSQGSCANAQGGFFSGNFPGHLQGPGSVWEITFDEALLASNPVADNVYPYKCSEHCFFGMMGTITVNVSKPNCPADLTGDSNVGVADLLELLAAWGPNPGHPADLTGDGNVGVADLLALLSEWGTCP